MHLVRATEEQLRIGLSRPEHKRFVQLLKMYPYLPPAHQKLSRHGKISNLVENEKFLHESLAEYRAQSRARLEGFLADPNRLHAHEDGFVLDLARGEVNWLVEVLNDIRVGSWVHLGSPENLKFEIDEKNVLHGYAMHVAGDFQMQLLMLSRKQGDDDPTETT